MGKLAEINLVKTITLYDWSVFTRWPFLVLLLITIVALYFTLRARKTWRASTLRTGDRALAIILILVFGAAAITALAFPIEARAMPMIASVTGALLAVLLIAKSLTRAAAPGATGAPRRMPWRLLSLLALYIACIPLGGTLVAGAAYAGMHSYIELKGSLLKAVLVAAAAAGMIWVLFGLLAEASGARRLAVTVPPARRCANAARRAGP